MILYFINSSLLMNIGSECWPYPFRKSIYLYIYIYIYIYIFFFSLRVVVDQSSPNEDIDDEELAVYISFIIEFELHVEVIISLNGF